MSEQFKTIAVIGLGYIGLPTASIIASHGIRVIGVDVQEATIKAISRGETPFVEPGLDRAVRNVVKEGLLTAQRTVPHADAYIIAVPTPLEEGNAPDLSFISKAVDSIAPSLRGGELVVIESTCPPGTTESVAKRLIAARPDLDQADLRQQIYVAHCPERVLPGRAMIEMVTNDRVIGGVTPEAGERAAALYRIFSNGQLLMTDSRTAELVKLVENSYRDVNIAFANELSGIARELDVDVWELIELANYHPRVNVLQPGPGVGGHCIPVDPWFLASALPHKTDLIRTARLVNDGKAEVVQEEIEDAIARTESPTLAVLGLAFKRDTGDLRASPALHIAHQIASRFPKVRILAVDPYLKELPPELSGKGNVELTQFWKAITEANIVAHLVDHAAFAGLDGADLEGRILIEACRRIEGAEGIRSRD